MTPDSSKDFPDVGYNSHASSNSTLAPFYESMEHLGKLRPKEIAYLVKVLGGSRI